MQPIGYWKFIGLIKFFLREHGEYEGYELQEGKLF
jgi:hypothetical protein